MTYTIYRYLTYLYRLISIFVSSAILKYTQLFILLRHFVRLIAFVYIGIESGKNKLCFYTENKNCNYFVQFPYY